MLKGVVHRLLCRFGWHDWEEVPEERREYAPGVWGYTNARCRHCLVRGWVSRLSEEEAEKARALLMDLQREARDSQWV